MIIITMILSIMQFYLIENPLKKASSFLFCVISLLIFFAIFFVIYVPINSDIKPKFKTITNLIHANELLTKEPQLLPWNCVEDEIVDKIVYMNDKKMVHGCVVKVSFSIF